MYNNIFQFLNSAGTCDVNQAGQLFSLESTPSLLLYSYVPAVIIALSLVLFIYFKDRKNLISRALVLFTFFYSFWVLNILLQWISVPNKLILMAWQMTAFFEVGLCLSALHLFVAFYTKEHITKRLKFALVFITLVMVVLTPTYLNISSYDFESCEGILGYVWYFIYAFELILPFSILIAGFIKSKNPKYTERKKEIRIFSVALFICLLVFSISNLVGEYYQYYSLNLFGPLGLLAFVGFVTYLILNFKLFNIRIFSTQILVIFLNLAIVSLLLINNLVAIHLITVFTFVLAVFFGYLLIMSVKKEIEQKENLERLRLKLEESNINLETANEKLKGLDKLKTEFLSLASHQLRSPLTAIKGYASMVKDGDFGEVAPKAKEAVERIFESSQNLTIIVEDLLNVSKIESGGMKYEKANFDMSEIVKTTAEDLSIMAAKKNIKLSYSADSGNHNVNGDKEKLRQVVLNFIDNSIKYTKEGTIEVKLENKNDKVLVSVKDTGMGVSPEIMATLFQKFARGEGQKMNTGGSGLGLYLAKEIVDAHKGRVWVESPGMGLGSTFFIELDAVN
ncbi:MAG: ATP-binding protein [Candidatus Nomurabacteria bacterium]|nr:ATP-binding protein [Candidatus Nomurabacteria bacterium]